MLININLNNNYYLRKMDPCITIKTSIRMKTRRCTGGVWPFTLLI